jgi:hypothetical protein
VACFSKPSSDPAATFCPAAFSFAATYPAAIIAAAAVTRNRCFLHLKTTTKRLDEFRDSSELLPWLFMLWSMILQK